ncbi:unnamed protein product [Cylicostephanus goldi]|uniref:Uncharacterized protein n=1 Tax=Cylicostephanus goldi TaxID=71465 RepID=A0A3P6SNX5_CYLGO|nr:unnamed protein product [Cylicostephanus goldi]
MMADLQNGRKVSVMDMEVSKMIDLAMAVKENSDNKAVLVREEDLAKKALVREALPSRDSVKEDLVLSDNLVDVGLIGTC